MDLTRTSLGEEHLDYAHALYRLGGLFLRQEDYPLARSSYSAALAVYERAVADRSADYANCLNELGLAFERQRAYAEAEPLFRKALEIRKEALGTNHPDYAWSLNNLGYAYKAQSQYAKAEPLLAEAIAIWKQVHGDRHPDYAWGLANLASLYYAKGEYSRAEPLYRQALDIRKAALGERHPDYASSLSDLSDVLRDRGHYAEAEPLIQMALGIRREALGTKHPRYADSLADLALLFDRHGDWSRAEPLCREVLAIRKEALGEHHPDYALALNNLAAVLQALGDTEAAIALYQQSLDVRKAVSGERNANYAWTLSNLASLKGSTEAEPLLRQVLEIRKEVLGERHPDYAQTLNQLAEVCDSLGQDAEAESLFRQAIEIRRQTLGEQHPKYANSLSNLGMLLAELGRAEEGLPLVRQAIEIAAGNLNATAAVQSERQQIVMMHYLSHACRLFSLSNLAGADGSDIYRLMWRDKGQVFVRQRATRRMREAEQQSPDSDAARTFALLSDRARELDRLANLVSDPETANANRGRLEELTLDIERLQQHLSTLSAEFRSSQQADVLTPLDLAMRLPLDAALIDFRIYCQFLPEVGTEGRTERQYVAFILRRDGPVQIAWLGPAALVDDAALEWREHFGTGASTVAGHILRHRVWEPLEPYLEGVTTVLVSPDNELNQIAWGALPGNEPGSFLIEERAFVNVPVPCLLPEIIDRVLDPAVQPALLAIGDVDYGADPGEILFAASDRSATAARDSQGIGAWNRLRETLSEVATI